jgi:hypothetical protein
MKTLGLLLALQLSTFAFTSSSFAEEIPVEFIDGKDAVIKDFCRTEDPGLYNECSFNNRTTMVNIYAPESFGKIILAHIDEAKKQAYYDELSRKDFFHGHLLLAGIPTNHDSPQAYFSKVTSVLYHTAEYNGRWEKEQDQGIPAEERRQRSIIGFINGVLVKAMDIMKDHIPPGFEGSGTIYDVNIAVAHPELAQLSPDKGRVDAKSIKVCKNGECRVCQPFGQFNIVKESTGRFTTANGEKVELFLRCFPLQ